MKIDYQKIKKTHWYRQGGACSPFYTNPAYRVAIKLYGGCSYYQGDNNYGYFDLDKERRLNKSIIKKQKKNKKYIDEVIKFWQSRRIKVDGVIAEIKRLDLSALTNKELFNLVWKLGQARHKIWPIGVYIESFDPWGDQILQAEVDFKKHQLSAEDLKTLVYPFNLSIINKSKLALVNLALKYKKQKPLLRQIKSKNFASFKKLNKGQPFLKDLAKIQKNYFWQANSWAEVKILTGNHFYQEFKKIIQNKKSLIQQKKETVNFHQAVQNKRTKLLKKNKFSPSEGNIFYLFAKMADWRELRKSLVLRVNHCFYLLIKELGRRFKLNLNLLKQADPLEFLDIRFNQGYINELNARSKHSILYWDDKTNKAYIFSGLKAKKLHSAFLNAFTKQHHEVKGIIACPGLVRGRVKIIITEKDFKKLKPGDILVTQMTRPEFLPIMKKAGAIVTDEGGVTCHAAIVSRELKIPCIIGTQVATSQLKDGDFIEVNADKGYVRKLKK